MRDRTLLGVIFTLNSQKVTHQCLLQTKSLETRTFSVTLGKLTFYEEFSLPLFKPVSDELAWVKSTTTVKTKTQC